MLPDLLAFAGVMALGQFSPGPDMLLLTRTALAQGRVAGWWTTAGITTGLCVHAAIAILGMAWLMAQGGWIATVLRCAAAAYLGWLGFRLLQQAFLAFYSGRKFETVSASGRRSAYVRGLLCNLLNPKAALFFAAVVAEFVMGARPPWWSAALWAIIVGQGMILWGAYVWFLQFPPFQRGYLRAGPWIDAAFGIGLLTLAAALLLKG
jgi:threonine/homoserine/homoserine lactone efflux protein